MGASIWNPGSPSTEADAGFDVTEVYSNNSVGKALQSRGVCVEDYPYLAKGDGVTDDSAAFIAALAANGTVYGRANAVYVVKDIVLNGRQFDGRGCVIRDAPNAAWGVKLQGYRPQLRNVSFQDQGNYVANTTLTATALSGSSSLSVASTTKMFVGQIIFIDVDSDDLYWNTVITNIVGTTVTIRDVLPSTASAGNQVLSLAAICWVETCDHWTVSNVLIVNAKGGLLIKPANTTSFSNRGTLENVTVDTSHYFGAYKAENAAGVKATNVKLWNGHVVVTTAAGNGTAGPFSFDSTVFLLRDLTVTVNGVVKTRGTHWNYASSTSIVFTAGNFPASGADIVMSHFRDSLRGFVEDQRNTTIISGGNLYLAMESLDAKIGVQLLDAELTDFTDLISDSCQYEALRLDGCASSVRFGKTFLGFSASSIVANSTNGVLFDELYTARVPTAETYLGVAADNILLNNSSLTINATNWTGGDYQRNTPGTSALDFTGLISISCSSVTNVAAGATVFLTSAGQAVFNLSPRIMPSAGQLLILDASSAAAPGAGQTFTYVPVVNGVDITVAQTVISGAATFSSRAIFVEGYDRKAEVGLKLITSAGAAVTTHRATLSAK